MKTKVDLKGVPETLLWTLYQRAVEARRSHAVLSDPKAIELIDSLDYPFEQLFGKGGNILAQGQALRVLCFDRAVKRFLAGSPQGLVVALGAGLETQFWRVDNGEVRWLNVDLAETIEVRQRLLPESPRQRNVACLVLDARWMDEVDAANGVLLTAQGLLMYLQPDEVHRLVADCARRFQGGSLLFDAVPRWFSAATMSGRMKTAGGYQAPPMPWAMDAAERERMRTVHNSMVELRDIPWPRGRGLMYGYVVPLLSAMGLMRKGLPFLPWIIMQARFR